MENKEDFSRLILPEPSHVGYVTKDLERSMEDLQKYFGLGPFKRMIPEYFNRRYHGELEDFKIDIGLCRVGNMVYELIQILQGRTIYEDFMNEHGEGIHHLGYEISDLTKWKEAYKQTGIEPIMGAERVGLRWAYFNTPRIVVELLERSPEGVVV